MDTQKLSPLGSRNKGVSTAKIGVVKLGLPQKFLYKILAFGNRKNLGHQTPCHRKGP